MDINFNVGSTMKIWKCFINKGKNNTISKSTNKNKIATLKNRIQNVLFDFSNLWNPHS